jgi:ligand-binding sensor domain-containing protein/signal transduction histidine kinase
MINGIAKRKIFFLNTLLLFILFTGCCCSLKAQRYPFYNLNVENGLIQSQPRALVQDKLGHLWIGTLGGLSRYDGLTFTNYSVRDGMPGNTVNTVSTDKAGNIWVGGTWGVSRYNGKAFKTYTFQTWDKQASNNIFQLKFQDNGVIWCLGSNKLFSLANEKTKQLITPDTNAILTALLVEKNSLMVAKAGGVIYRLANKRWDSLIVPPHPFLNTIVTQIFRDSRQRLWITSNRGLFTTDSGRIVKARFSNQSNDLLPALLSITEDRSGALWIGTNSGVIRVADSAVSYFSKRSGLSDNSFPAMLTDGEGNVWMASDGQGLFRYSGTQFTVVDESTGLPSGQVTSIEADRWGRIYLGTYDAGLHLYEDGVVSSANFPLKSVAITALKYRNGSLWIGTRGAGLWKYNGEFYYSYTAESGKIISDNIASLYTDDKNRLWIGFGNGAMRYDGDSFKTIPVGRLAVQDFVQLGGDSILMATSRGLSLYHDNAIHPFTTGTVLDTASPQCFTLRGRELWTGTSDNGIIYYELDTKKLIVIDRRTGLQSDFIYNIITDNAGNIWAGTGYGIHKVTLNEKGEPSIFFFGKGHGMRGMESNHNAILKMPDGGIWFGTTNGALHYKAQSQLIVPQPTSIVMQSVKLFGENDIDSSSYDSTDVWYRVPYGLHLPHKKNTITFTFHAISLGSNEQIKYRYKIEGLDAPWSVWSATNTVTFSALPPGNYKLRVQCMALGANQQPKELVYPFEIITPFHKTNWFRLLILLGCIILGIAIQYIANRRKQNRLRLMEKLRREEQNKVRERTAEDFHDEVGNRLTRINVLTNVLKKKVPLNQDGERIITQIQDNAAQLYSGTRDILWSLKPANDSLYEILHRIRDFGGELFQDTEIDFTFIGSDERWKNYRLPLDVSRNLIMIFKEALNNCLKYSEASQVRLEAYLREDDAVQLILTDNGVGFDIHYVKRGHGIDNMTVRATRIHGRLYIDSVKGKGTITTLTFRIPKNIIPSNRG